MSFLSLSLMGFVAEPMGTVTNVIKNKRLKHHRRQMSLTLNIINDIVAYNICCLCKIITFVAYDVCYIIGFVPYDICCLIGFVTYEVCRIMTFCHQL